jgi:16S rRNA (guanine(966)-N(2))-methyltransferase RsmD
MLASDGVFAPGDEAERETAGPRVLDLYAGSGALGLEALSRGAREVVLVESARPALASIRENVAALGVGDQVTVVAMRVERVLAEGLLHGPFDIVMLDPPYADVQKASLPSVLAKSARLLAASGILTIEHASADVPTLPDELVLDRQRRHGDTSLSLYRPRFRILGAGST